MKEQILKFIKEYFELEYFKLSEIAKESKEGTTGDEVKQEGKYDTRAIEAGYLAGAQARRAQEIRIELVRLDNFQQERESTHLNISLGSIK